MVQHSLSEKQKSKIVELHEKHRMTCVALAERFGVKRPAIDRVIREWKEKKAE